MSRYNCLVNFPLFSAPELCRFRSRPSPSAGPDRRAIELVRSEINQGPTRGMSTAPRGHAGAAASSTVIVIGSRGGVRAISDRPMLPVRLALT